MAQYQTFNTHKINRLNHAFVYQSLLIVGLDKDTNGKFKINYDKSNALQLHKLLSKHRISKTHLSIIVGVSNTRSAVRLINQPYLLSLQQLINLSFALDISLYELCKVITEDFKNCVTSFDTDLLLFVPPHIRELTKSNEWFER